MSRLDSRRSAMDDTVIAAKSGNKRRLNGAEEAASDDGEGGETEEQCDEEAWETLGRGFRLAQSVLDQNRALIQQVNDNHRSRASENLAKNVGLIREINGNISKVLSIYSDLSVNFSSIVHQRRRITSENNDDDKVEEKKPEN